MESKKTLRVIVVGRTGAGKTTFITMIANMMLGLNYDDQRINTISQCSRTQKETETEHKLLLTQLVSNCAAKQTDRSLERGTEISLTLGCNIYEFENQKIKLYITDTPGFGDTSGLEQDQVNKDHIASGIKRMGSFDAIILVQKASEARLDISLRYFITEVKGMLTKDCEDNIIVCFTHAINADKIDAQRPLEVLGIPLKHICCFENDCLSDPAQIKKNLSPEDLSNYCSTSERYWKNNKNNFDKMLGIISGLETKDSKPVVQLHNRKYVLLAMLREVSRTAEQLRRKRAEVESRKQQLLKVDAGIRSDKDYSVEVEILESKSFIVKVDEYYEDSNNVRRVRTVDRQILKVVPRKVLNVDHEMKKRYDCFLEEKKILESEIKKADSEIDQLGAEMEPLIRKMAYLSSWIYKNSMDPRNDYIQEYGELKGLDTRKKYVPVEGKVSTLNDIRAFQLNFMEVVREGLLKLSSVPVPSSLSPEEQKDIDIREEFVEKELERWADEARRAI